MRGIGSNAEKGDRGGFRLSNQKRFQSLGRRERRKSTGETIGNQRQKWAVHQPEKR